MYVSKHKKMTYTYHTTRCAIEPKLENTGIQSSTTEI